jgi:hypothetical protein
MQEPENTLKQKVVEADNSLKEMFVQYVGEKLQPKNGEVTVEMVVDVLADEFPDFLLVVAEENFIRGYKQAFADLENANKQQQQAT